MVAASELMLSIAGRIVYALSVDFREAFAPSISCRRREADSRWCSAGRGTPCVLLPVG